MTKPFIVKLGNAWDAGNNQTMVYSRNEVVDAIKAAFGRLEEKKSKNNVYKEPDFNDGVSESVSRFTVVIDKAWDAGMNNLVYKDEVVFNAIKDAGGVVLVNGNKVG